MDMLEDIFRMQGDFDDYILKHRPEIEADQETWVRRLAMFLIAEGVELLESTNWAWWRNDRGVDWENIETQEIPDLLHGLVSLAIHVGMDAEDFHRNYKAKNIENFYRQQGKSERKGYEIDELVDKFLEEQDNDPQAQAMLRSLEGEDMKLVRGFADRVQDEYCGDLTWTVEQWGKVVHKEFCPHRKEPYHQGDPSSPDNIKDTVKGEYGIGLFMEEQSGKPRKTRPDNVKEEEK